MKIISSNQIVRFISFATIFLKEITISEIPTVVRDRNDDYLLAICEACDAHFLVTGDDDLLSLEIYKNTTIVSMSQFIKLLTIL